MNNPYLQFIRGILKDLNLGKISDTLKQKLEFNLLDLLDQTIEKTLVAMLTEKDLAFYENYLKQHPDAKKEEAFDQMIAQRKEIQNAIQDALAQFYDDMMQVNDITKTMIEDKKILAAKTNAQNK
ncbi:MAG: hypothetical protein WCW30_02205 [Candidatus Gracilibacteria bacterium]|jgi:hypothetical protein